MQMREDALLPSQKDFVIYDVRWILEADPDVAGAIGRTRAYNEALVRFLRENGLFSCPDKWQGFEDWSRFALSVGDLTDEGFALVKRCHDKWLCGIDRHGRTPGDMALWVRELNGLRGMRQ